jgi:hypothetical protein
MWGHPPPFRPSENLLPPRSRRTNPGPEFVLESYPNLEVGTWSPTRAQSTGWDGVNQPAGMGSRPQPLRLLPFMPHSLASFILVAGLLAAAAAAAAGWLLSAGSSGYM